jgi:hypothetical protein
MDGGIGFGATTLESRFSDYDRPVLLTGIQALLRLLLEQRVLDQTAGLNTAALVSGYRGSPLGMLDRELWLHEKLMKSNDIRFEPGVNEDLAATMLMGTQQVDAFPGRAWTGPATPSIVPTWRAPTNTAVCWRWPAMTTGRIRPLTRTRQNTFSKMSACPCSILAPCRT